jgi:hypothetical protein
MLPKLTLYLMAVSASISFLPVMEPEPLMLDSFPFPLS